MHSAWQSVRTGIARGRAARAESVMNYLERQGVSNDRIVAVGYGETEPRATNATAEGRQLNRRVEISVKATTG